jgi:hypothetical protein
MDDPETFERKIRDLRVDRVARTSRLDFIRISSSRLAHAPDSSMDASLFTDEFRTMTGKDLSARKI